MSEWEDFKTKCPSCDNNETIHWTIDQCHLIINKEGYIKCNNSSCQHNQNPTFIMELKFKCGKHEARKPNSTNVWAALAMVSSIVNLSKTERTKLFFRINNYDD
jgi:hypothetical protein